jgi:peptide/nickel transport system permease protein
MFSLVVRRLLFSIPVLLLLTLVLFFAVKLVPGDAALIMAGERATPEKVEYIRKVLHLDQEWYVQYGHYIWGLVTRLDLGNSLHYDAPIVEVLRTAVPATLELGFFALLIAVPVGVALGMLGAVFRGKFIDRLASAAALSGVSMPIFWLALILMYVFSIQLGWLPTSGRMYDEIAFDPALDSLTRIYSLDGLIFGLTGKGWDVFLYALRHVLLPALALSSIPMAHICRMTRSAFLEVLGQDYVRTARAKGVSPTMVVLKHAFRNASLQIVTVTALQAGVVFGGAVITETMFSWPGLGKILVESIANRDFPMVQSGTLFVGVVFVLFNLLADLLYGVLDPRVKRAPT